MTVSQLAAVACSGTANATKFIPYLTDACVRYNIQTPVRQLCFLAQVSHESGGLFYTEELASGQAYEHRPDLGNIQPGDGPRFKGRGLIQITGRSNYTLLGKVFQIDLLDHPELLGGKSINACTPDQLRWAAMSAGWFWNKTALNLLADKISLAATIDEGSNLEYFREITRKINGGYNGLADRVHRYKAGLNQFLSATPITVTS